MIRVKSGVEPRNLIIAAAAANVAEEMNRIVTITSGTDGKHMDGSKHYTSEALDFRLLGRDTPTFIERMREHLGREYDVILETDHVHVEFDPKVSTP